MTEFDTWLTETYADGPPSGFTAIIVLVSVDADGVQAAASSFVHVSDGETRWVDMLLVLQRAGCEWDAVVFFPVRASEGGGPVADDVAREHRATCEQAVLVDPLSINKGFFCDLTGQRLVVEEQEE